MPDEKIFAAIHAHLSDVPYLAAGFCAKLMADGYTGYLVRTTNDETSGGGTNAQNVLSNETEHLAMGKRLGFKDVFDLSYRSHRMNGISPVEFRGRLVLLLRMLKPTAVLSFYPSAEGEPDSDHWITGRAVEEACWTAGSTNDFHEHFEAGLAPWTVRERYYFHARPAQAFNRVVDVTPQIDKKIDAIVECRSQGNGNAGSKLRARLAKNGRRLPLLGDDDRAADRAYAREFLLQPYREYASGHDFEYGERFFYAGPDTRAESAVEEYIATHATRIAVP